MLSFADTIKMAAERHILLRTTAIIDRHGSILRLDEQTLRQFISLDDFVKRLVVISTSDDRAVRLGVRRIREPAMHELDAAQLEQRQLASSSRGASGEAVDRVEAHIDVEAVLRARKDRERGGEVEAVALVLWAREEVVG
mgnify:CR=1 FL=1